MAPVKEPYYSLKQVVESRGNGRFEAVIEATRTDAGETTDQALSPGSVFQHVLSDFIAEEEYLVLLVDSSSFETFRTVRQVIRERGLPYGWRPYQSHTIRFSDTGQMIGEQIEE